MQLDLSNRSLVMEINEQKIIVDTNLGDFEYSPFLKMHGSEPLEVTIL